tara:strand:- start:568 stop:831 length:264 start_codon:yes stop_codon:yes gene_type:complete
MINQTEEWLYKKAKEVDSEIELQDLYTSKFSFGGRWVMDLLEEYHKEQLTLTEVVKSFHCLDESYHKIDRCRKQCVDCINFVKRFEQ